jgi:uncharacterized protein YkwD
MKIQRWRGRREGRGAWLFPGSLSFALTLALGLSAQADDESPNALIAALVQAHNKERAAAKLPPLSTNPKLEAAALAHARDMAEHEKMTHEGSDGSTPEQRIDRAGYHGQRSGENIAEGQPTVDAVMRAWMNSPEHKKNILGEFSEIGAAMASDADRTPYWCVDFGLGWPRLDPREAATQLVESINKERAKADKPPLKVNAKLETAASQHAAILARLDELKPKEGTQPTVAERLAKLGYRFARLGEAFASGLPTPTEAMSDWLNEANQHENILGDFTETGVGYARAESGKPYWSLLLAKPLH